MTGLLMTGSAAHTAPPAHAPDSTLAAATTSTDQTYPVTDQSASVTPTGTEQLGDSSTETPLSEGDSLINGPLDLQDVEVPQDGTRGIPEPLLAAYRNAELSAESSMPKCGLPWYLLAGIGKVESNHAANGRIDEKGTTKGTIFGPALDGTLPGNEIIKASDGSFVRAVGPMQFLPGTWAIYAADGDGDGNTDPNNVFDATLAAGKYLCSGGLDLRDPQQEMRAVLRYNNSRDYATLVLSWANAYKTGGATPVEISAAVPDSMPDGSMPEGTGSSMVVDDPAALAPPADPPADPAAPTTTETPSTTPAPTTTVEPTGTATPNGTLTLQIHVLINVPGRGQIPCGIFCTPPAPGTPAPKPGPLRLPGPPPTMPLTIPGLPDNKRPTTTVPVPPKTSAPATTTTPAPTTSTPPPVTTPRTTTPTTSPSTTVPTVVEPKSQRTPSTAPGSSPARPAPTSTATPPPPAPAVAPPPAAAPSAQQSAPAPQQPPAAQSQPAQQPQAVQPPAAPPATKQPTAPAPAPTTAEPKPTPAKPAPTPAKPVPTTTPPPPDKRPLLSGFLPRSLRANTIWRSWEQLRWTRRGKTRESGER
ncbi:lytic transglycosylase domain-containing protein [Nocardia brasiliensis]|uniref:lytic transglycosylase domain-containing protein n=1 Tax=Nocardia brasiliensis TaxID=37326 RepID=UPI0002EB8972|nr:lytic murein transglycosylase [Nocardia brasiliensis]